MFTITLSHFSLFINIHISHQPDLFDEMTTITLVNINLLGHNIWLLIKMRQHLFVILYM